MIRLKIQKKILDLPLIITVLLLVFGGLFLIFDASPALGQSIASDPFFFVKNQIIFVFVGILAAVALILVDYHTWARFSFWFVLASALLLILVLVPGVGTEIYGARRWIVIGGNTFQPSELAKLALIIFFSSYFSGVLRKTAYEPRFGPFLVISLLTSGLVFIQPDLGTALIILAISFSIYFLSGMSILRLFVLLPAFALVMILAIVSAPYRLNRLTAFLNPTVDPQGISYHVNQVLIALSNGGLLGAGVGESRQKFAFLPEVTTDSIFAVLAEEFGFVGGVILIVTVVFLIWRIFVIAKRAPDNFGRYLVLGIGAWLAIQSIVNLSSMVAMLPLTGVPLPFISYGGTSLVVAFASIGLVLSVSRQKVVEK